MKAILTGHTRGLGAAIARELLSRGIAVFGISRNRNAEFAKQFPSLFQQAELDLGDSAALVKWLQHGTLRQFIGSADTVLLINNAGIVQPVGPIQAQDIALVAQAVNLNVAAPMMLASAVTAAARTARDVRILHISSGAARNAYAGWSVYCASKAALDHHARAVTLDRSPDVRIVSLAPGVIDTDMQAAIRGTPLEHFPLRERFEQLKRENQLTHPAECAKRVIDYLLDEGFGHEPVDDLRSAP
jgi:NAD(P)-dependent dehydrogenase (short-subunit alcohol dehydrogenase family)